ncbi:thioredoxin family protein [Candidatus Uabimicrobium sp. HlEnr_7]|uniref:thioredoxin family protein n=1 Tax=Candidatus Uabimicrobium helgolandensis TaxID=3095367 RepID=UPI003557F4A9
MKYVFLIIFCLGSVFAENIFRPLTLEQAHKFAQKSDKNIVVYFEQENWKPCRLMRHLTFQDKNVQKWLRQSIPIKISREQNSEIIGEFDINIFPTILILNKNKHILHRIEAFLSAQELLKIVNYKVPSVEISVEGHHMNLFGRKHSVKGTMKNGSVELNDISIEFEMPEGIKIVESSWTKKSQSGILKRDGKIHISHLNANEKIEFKIRFVAKFQGKHCIHVHFTNKRISKTTQYCVTSQGMPALLLEAIDEVDPLTVGEYTTYIVQISN